MQALTHPTVLKRAGLAAFLSVLACYPRLALWEERKLPAEFMSVMLLFCMFILWGFVLAWHQRYSGRPVFAQPFRLPLWLVGTLGAAVWAVGLYYIIDPQQRLMTPGNYPTDWKSWIVMTLFSLSFDPLFICFAPFAFFIRLSNRQTTAMALTVIFGIFILYLRINTAKTLPSFPVIVEMVLLRVVTGYAWLYCYLKGGIFFVWWLGILLQLRLPFEFTPPT